MKRNLLKSALLLQLVTALALGCDPADEGEWIQVAGGLSEALLSIAGTSATDVWAVGADKGQGPLVLHYDGEAWERVETGHHGSLWWAHAFAPDDVFVGGASGAILRYDGSAFTRMDTPGLGRETVFGIWGSSPTNVYAVGGFAGRAGFIWRYDGEAWTSLALPRDIPLQSNGDWPGLFKVWGDGAGRVWVVGGRGLVLLSEDGTTFRVVETGVTQTLFTIAGANDAEGRASRLVAVGGASNCTVVEAGDDGMFTDVSPPLAPLLQGISVRPDGTAWASGQGGVMWRRDAQQGWLEVDHGLGLRLQSLHATWIDPDGGVWAVGGDVLDPSLANGAIIHFGGDVARYEPNAPVADGGVPDAGPPAPVCPEDAIDLEPEGSIARRWNEQILNAIRRDIPRPGVHARNLYHLAAAMWDAWAAYDESADGVFVRERLTAADVEAAREEAISYAAYRVLAHRYDGTRAVQPGSGVSQACFRGFMGVLGYDPDDTTNTGDSPRALGNRIGEAIIAANADDGANEGENYADITNWMPMNPPLVVDQPGVTLPVPSYWQQINLFEAATQNGIILPAGTQGYIGTNWGGVTPFALTDRRADGLYVDPGEVPSFDSPEMKEWVVGVIRGQAELQVNATTIDISPGSYGNNPLGTNDGSGHPVNPVTGEPYAPNVVPLGDFARVLAEHWADGPRSETPPGHWNTIANYVTDHPMHRRCLAGTPDFETCRAGTSPEMDALEWDVKAYLALDGAVHDAAIVAWGIKRQFSGARPISLVRHMAQLGQSSDPSLPSYDEDGLPLVDGLIELVTEESSAPGQRHERLAPFVGQVVLLAWPGEPGDRANDTTPIQWIRGVDWVPYQRRNFVTPGFPGYVSGHSTFSRAAAEVLTDLNGDPYFPGGLGEFVARERAYLVFERGPSVEVRLQWGTYYDAADQAGQSRIFGGIHIVPDDFAGRRFGSLVGLSAVARARQCFDGTAVAD
jgi:hypothetical protein